MTEAKANSWINDKRAIYAIVITSILSWAFAFLATNIYQDYTFGLFIWLPFVLGAVSTLIYGYNYTNNRKRLYIVSFLTLVIFCFGLLIFAWEGVICLIMALPVGLFFMWLGHMVGYKIIKSKIGNVTTITVLLCVSVPSLMAFEDFNPDVEEIRSVVTSVEITAPPDNVWENVIAFPQLDEPSEIVFKAGIAYPINATIKGHGVGSIRSCNFSTGSFIEPITIWNEPNLLKFSVLEQPEPMKEISIYDIHPNHLHGYWISKEGQFKLTKLANGKTLLEGTTWYVNKIKPDFYWTLWSDYMVHKIHYRVLQHIKKQAEM
jgi:hypothetical protein